MRTNLLLIFWRRKLSVVVVLLSFVLLGLWTWTFLLNNIYSSSIFQNFSGGDKSSKDAAYVLQKLIYKANRLIRNQRDKDAKSQHLFTGGAAARDQLGQVEVDSTQALAFMKRQKKFPLLGESYLFEEERLKILENQQRARSGGFEELNNNNMDYDRMLSSADRQSQYEHELERMGVPVISGIGPEGSRPPNDRLVHLDLKGAPPKLTFLKRILPMLKILGATGLLIEYEDMFPFLGALHPLSAKNAYKMDELKDFLEAVAMNGLSVMPLVQTFGHMEYALKLAEFQQMREIDENPQSICPSQKQSISFIEDMLTQVIDFHLHLPLQSNSSKSDIPSEFPLKFTHIHIGCDEVFRMGECERCRQRSRNEIFLTHVTTIANFVRNRWPQLHVVIWDDMLRDMSLTEMLNSHIGNYVEPMVWVYVPDIYHFIQPQLWDMYSKVFATAWAASAFKGAFGESLMVPPLQRHLENNIRWLAVIAKEGGRFAKGFKGLALTGWQRYDHFAVLCELLSTGLPSLITSLSTVSKGYFSTNPKDNDILRVLECSFHPDNRHSSHPWLELNSNAHHSQLFTTCTYPGSMAYKYVLKLFDKISQTQNYLLHVQEKSAWMSDYNVRHNFSSPLRVRGLAGSTPALIHELTAMAREAHEVMYEIYDEYTIAEFVEQTIYPLIASLRKQLDHADYLLQRHTWVQRPLPIARELIDLNLIPSEAQVYLQQQQQQQQALHHLKN